MMAKKLKRVYSMIHGGQKYGPRITVLSKNHACIEPIHGQTTLSRWQSELASWEGFMTVVVPKRVPTDTYILVIGKVNSTKTNLGPEH